MTLAAANVFNRSAFFEDLSGKESNLLPIPQSDNEVLAAILRSLFVSLPDFNQVFLYCPAESVVSLSLLGWLTSSLREIPCKTNDPKACKCKLFFCHRFDLVPELLIRKATVEGLLYICRYINYFII